MKLLILAFLNLFTGTPISIVPEKLRLYQNVTGIDDFKLLNIFHQSLGGINNKVYSNKILYWGRYENTFPKFRYKGTVPSGEKHPVIWTPEEVNVDTVMNGGVFLCMNAGYYHFAAAISNNGEKTSEHLAITIVHNSRDGVYARYE